jgi:hypothetical protein
MTCLTVHLGGPLVAPIATPRRFPSDWRARAFVEAFAAPARHPDQGHGARHPAPPSVTHAASRHQVQTNGARR